MAVVEEEQEDSPLGEYERLDAAVFLSQSLLDVSFIDAQFLSELAISCDLAPGDLLSLTINSFPTLPFISSVSDTANTFAYRAPWTVMDACKGVVACGVVATGLYGQEVVVLDPPFTYSVDGNGQQVGASYEPNEKKAV